jgi:alcohol dehydrogenase class IV
MRAFDYESLPSRVIFGRGALAKASGVAEDLGMRRVLVVATRSQAQVAHGICEALGPAAAAVFDRAAMHTPVEVTAEVMQLVELHRVDGVLAVGGGSAVGLSKAIALRTDLPQIVIPTTYAGSEITPVLGQTEKGVKTIQRTARVLPEAVIYDVELTLSLPPAVSVTSGFNAMAHAVEGLYSQYANRLILGVAEECVRAMAQALPRIVLDPADLEARAEAQEAGWLGGWCLANAGSALHHRLCHILGGAFDLPHAETHTILLPHVLAFNLKAAPEAAERLVQALEAGHPAEVLFDLAQSLGAPVALKDIGMPRDGIDQVIRAALQGQGWNPRPIDEKSLRGLLLAAWRGTRPR